jgi:predicted MarR family transcription regulator
MTVLGLSGDNNREANERGKSVSRSGAMMSQWHLPVRGDCPDRAAASLTYGTNEFKSALSHITTKYSDVLFEKTQPRNWSRRSMEM